MSIMENNKSNPEQDPKDNEQDKPKMTDEQAKKHHKTTAADIDSIITGATDAVRSRQSSGNMGSTGTNVSYEGATAPGGAGSAGTGYGSGQDATGAGINEGNEDDLIREEKRKDEKDEDEDDADNAEDKDDETLGNP
jgi:hypothetical protein